MKYVYCPKPEPEYKEPEIQAMRLDLDRGFELCEFIVAARAGTLTTVNALIRPKDPELWNTLVRWIAAPNHERIERPILLVHLGRDWYIQSADHRREAQPVEWQPITGTRERMITSVDEYIELILCE